MGIQLRSFAFGFFGALFLLIGGIFAFVYIGFFQDPFIFHEQVLPSGQRIKVTMCTFAWGIDHSDRSAREDRFILEYVSTKSHSDELAIDSETREAFELIRPITELWGLHAATVSAFPSAERKGRYFRYEFTRDSNGQWRFIRSLERVFITDS